MAQWTQALWAVLNIPLSSKVNTPLCVQISSAWLPLSQFTHNISLLPHPNLLPLFSPFFFFFFSVHVAYLTSAEFLSQWGGCFQIDRKARHYQSRWYYQLDGTVSICSSARKLICYYPISSFIFLSKWQKVASQQPTWTKWLFKKKELFICRGVSWSWQGLVLSPVHLGLRPECVPAQRAHQISFGDPCCSAWDTTAWISFHFTALYEHFLHYLPFDLECLRQLLQKHWHLQGKGEFSAYLNLSSIQLLLCFFILSSHFLFDCRNVNYCVFVQIQKNSSRMTIDWISWRVYLYNHLGKIRCFDRLTFKPTAQVSF